MNGDVGEWKEASRLAGKASRDEGEDGGCWLLAAGSCGDPLPHALASALLLNLLLGEPETIVTPDATAAVMAVSAA